MEHYKLALMGELSVTPVYFNGKLDTLVLRPNATDQQLQEFASTMGKMDRELVTKIAFRESNFFGADDPVISYFPRVEHITVLYKHYEEGQPRKVVSHNCPFRRVARNRLHYIDSATMWSSAKATKNASNIQDELNNVKTWVMDHHNLASVSVESQGYCQEGYDRDIYNQGFIPTELVRRQKYYKNIVPIKDKYVPGTSTGCVVDELARIELEKKEAEEKQRATEAKKAKKKMLAQKEKEQTMARLAAIRERERKRKKEAREALKKEKAELKKQEAAARKEKKAAARRAALLEKKK